MEGEIEELAKSVKVDVDRVGDTSPSSRITAGVELDDDTAAKVRGDMILERYRYVLTQVRTANDNIYRYLAIWQTLSPIIIAAQVGLYVNWQRWQISLNVVRASLIALAFLYTAVSLFIVLLTVIGVWSWFHYRREETALADMFVAPGFRKPPRIANLFTWHETYIVLFVALTVVGVWAFTLAALPG